MDCDFGDTGQGQKSVQFRGSPLYTQTFSGIGLDGLYSYPLGFLSDNNESRNMPFGMFSLQGGACVDKLIKLANECDGKGNKELADALDEILKDIGDSAEGDMDDKLEKLELMLDEYKEVYDSERDDTGLLWELSQKWFGARQVAR